MTKDQKVHMSFSLLSAAVLSLQLASSAPAQGVFVPKLDLESAVLKALESDPQVRASQTLSKIAGERVREARTGWQPTVQLNQSFVRSNNPSFVFASLLEQGRLRSSDLS